MRDASHITIFGKLSGIWGERKLEEYLNLISAKINHSKNGMMYIIPPLL